MTDKELKKQLKKLGIAFAFILLFLVVLSVYTLGSTKAELSIYEQGEYDDTIKVLGLNEDELKQYFSVIGNLVMENEQNEKVKMLDMTTNFIDTMCSAYEVEIGENGKKYYDAKMVSQVLKEMNGSLIKASDELGGAYTYSKEQDAYFKNEASDKMPYCTQIEKITKKQDKMEVTFQLAFMTSSQMAQYTMGKQIDVQTQTIKATILEHTDYEYCKYFLSNLEMNA